MTTFDPLDVECPTCHAVVGRRCRSVFTPEEERMPHADRVTLARASAGDLEQ